VWLLPHGIENDRIAYLAGLVMEECRRRRIIVPSPVVLERLCVKACEFRFNPAGYSDLMPATIPI
jgi:hypothetical protein